MPTIPYLHFRGHCAEAMELYADIFGATDLQMVRYDQAPDMPEPMRDGTRILHAQLTLGDGTLMASDFPPGTDGDAQAAVSVMQAAPDLETGRAWFDRLAEGGDVVQDWGPSFFAAGFGMVRDRFGTHWMITVPVETEGGAGTAR